MIQNNNLSVLPWYQSLDEQNHRKTYSYGDVYPLFTPLNMLLPFQIVRPHRTNGLNYFRIYKIDGTQVADLTTQIAETGLSIVPFAALGYDVIVYTAILPLIWSSAEGQYYAQLSDGAQTWYSEVFTLVNMTNTNYLTIEWYDVENMVFDDGQIVYVDPLYKNRLYLCTQLGKPEYVLEEEGENRDGYFFPEKQVSEKTYRFVFLAPEYLCDVMRIISMSDFVTVTDNYGRVYPCDTFLITPKWQTQGNLASVEAEFQTATVIKKIGRGYITPTGGDFNNDYNNDFKNNIL